MRSTFPTGYNSNLKSHRYGPPIERDVNPFATGSVLTLRVTTLQQVTSLSASTTARPVRTELPSLCRTICRCCLPKVTKNLLLLLRSASLTTAHLHHLAPRSMLKGLLTLRLEDCASSHLKLAASRCSLSYAASTASCLRSRNSCKISSTTTCATAAPIGGR